MQTSGTLVLVRSFLDNEILGRESLHGASPHRLRRCPGGQAITGCNCLGFVFSASIRMTVLIPLSLQWHEAIKAGAWEEGVGGRLCACRPVSWDSRTLCHLSTWC